MHSTLILSHLDKAERFIRSARLIVAQGDVDSAASRLYYAMYHTARELLNALGYSYSGDSAVIAAYGREFAKPGGLAHHYHRLLHQAYTQMQRADNPLPSGLTEADIEPMLADARSFLADARAWLAAHPPQP